MNVDNLLSILVETVWNLSQNNNMRVEQANQQHSNRASVVLMNVISELILISYKNPRFTREK